MFCSEGCLVKRRNYSIFLLLAYLLVPIRIIARQSCAGPPRYSCLRAAKTEVTIPEKDFRKASGTGAQCIVVALFSFHTQHFAKLLHKEMAVNLYR